MVGCVDEIGGWVADVFIFRWVEKSAGEGSLIPYPKVGIHLPDIIIAREKLFLVSIDRGVDIS